MASPVPTAWMHSLVALTLFVVLWLLYQQSFAFDYVHFDDADYVIKNPMVMAGLTWEGVQWAFTSFYASNWHPLTWLSHMFDVSLWGAQPAVGHIHNTVLHGLNSVLVYLLLMRLAASWWQAGLLAMIFLVHPLHIESVAWIAERKDLVCALFYLLGLLAYDNYRANPRLHWYLVVLLCLTLALMSKPMAVSFPVVLVLMDILVYRDRLASSKSRNNILSLGWVALRGKAPFIALTLAACVLTVLAQDGSNAVAYLPAHSLTSRLEISSSAYLIYIKQWFLPLDLIAFYPLVVSGKTLNWLLPSAVVMTGSVAALLLVSSRPRLALGWAWYLITLLPVIGLVQVGSQAHADRYMYLPSIGLLIIAIGIFPKPKNRQFRIANFLVVVFIAYLSVLCYWQIGSWRNEHTLFSRVLEIAGPNRLAHLHLAKDYIRRGMLDEATQHSIASITLEPNSAGGYQALGNIALERQDFSRAEEMYLLALEKGPAMANMVNNLGISLAEQGKLAEAIRAFETAGEINPRLEAAKSNLALYQNKLDHAAKQ